MRIKYEDPQVFSIEISLEKIETFLHQDYLISKRSMAVLLLCEDEEVLGWVREKEQEVLPEIDKIIKETKAVYHKPLNYLIATRLQQEASSIADKVIKIKAAKKTTFPEKLSIYMMYPLTGIPMLILVLYFGVYKFVGGFGAGVLVNFLEGEVFEKYLTPVMVKFFSSSVPFKIINDLLVGEYGVITLGVRYAIAIILPIVTVFFIAFSIIEDTGYLPRLAMLIDNMFKKIGLSGRAVIPMVLGFGCDTMATMVTRTLPTKRERLIASLLLALAVPCSAQLGVIIALLGGNTAAFLIWAAVIMFVFIFVGYISAKVLPGERPSFYMEIPPLRLPNIANVITKTYTRVKWYMKEILPIFLAVSFFIWLGQITKIFDVLIWVFQKPVKLIGLPPETAKIFLLGFFRRDYGAAGLYDLNKAGEMTGGQLVVACVALTLFLPCIAQFMMNVKERGLKTGLLISAFVLVVSFCVAYVLNKMLVVCNISL
ncbi:MAG: nucleoside recognition domain-containing protein [Candidatus Omnitrophota bacterium]